MSESKDDNGQKSYHGHKVKIVSLLTAFAWVEFLEGPQQGSGRVKLSLVQLERVPEEKPAPAAQATGVDEDDKPLAPAAPAAKAPVTAPTAAAAEADEWREAADVW